MAAVTLAGRALEYAGEEMKNTEAVVVAAVTQNGTALEFASEEMKKNANSSADKPDEEGEHY
jgi:hypothetical protein